MKVIKEYNSFDDLYENSWSGAKDTLEDIINNNLENEFMSNLENIYFCDSELFGGEIPSETEVNDFIWFERETIYHDLGLNENGKKED